MKIRNQHGPTIGAGVIIGLLLQQHVWLIVVLSVAVGWVLRDLYSAARWAALAVGSTWARKHPERAMARKLLRNKVPY